MASFLDQVHFTRPEWLRIGDHRNTIAAIVSGLLFFGGWWIAIDAAACYPDKSQMKDVFHICGVFSTIAMIMVNMVSNRRLSDSDYTSGCLGMSGARIWFFIGYLMAFASLFGSGWILFGEYLNQGPEKTFNPSTTYPGVAILLQNLFILVASIIYKFGRTEDN